MYPSDYLVNSLVVTDIFARLNIAADKTSKDLLKLDTTIAKLTASIANIINRSHGYSTDKIVRQQDAWAPPRALGYSGSENESTAKTEAVASSEIKDNIKMFKSFTDVAKGGVSVAEAVKGTSENFSSVVKTMKGMTGMASGILGAAEGTATLLAGTTIVETITGLGTAVVGLEGMVAAALTISNPVGWLIGGTVLAAGAIGYVIHNDRKNKEAETPSFVDVARSNSNSAINIAAQHAKEGGYYAGQAIKNDGLAKDAGEIKRLTNQFLKSEQIYFDYQKAQAPGGVYLTALNRALDISNNPEDKRFGKEDKRIINVWFGDEKDKAGFQETFDQMRQFPLAVLPKKPIETVVPTYSINPALPMYRTEKRMISSKEYDQRQGVKYSGDFFAEYFQLQQNMNASVAMESYLQHGYDYVKKYYDGKRKQYAGLPEQLAGVDREWKLFLDAKQLKEQNDREPSAPGQRSVNVRGANVSTGQQKTIRIDIHGPLIENFTVKSANAHEGGLAVRQEVEKVLLEIVDSVEG